MSELTINGRKCLLYECDEQPQVLLIQPVGEHFVTPHLRLARAFAWCINSLTSS